jgi:signal transduction histidine kinase
VHRHHDHRSRRALAPVARNPSGIGIAAEHLGRIFDRFYRVDEARDRASGGNGLGLAIAARAAPVIGARIEVRSEPGAGSVFSLSLPVATTSAAHGRP